MLVLKSSNKYKISEYKRLLKDVDIDVQEGEDLKEVVGSIDEVIIYKTLNAGENVLVEDTAFIVNGKEEIEIKWKQNELITGDEVTWIISLGLFKEGKIIVYRGMIDAVVNKELGTDGAYFEPFIVPLDLNPDKMSYTELAKIIDKDLIDPRAMAVDNLLEGVPELVVPIEIIKK